jgi:diacylglycerol kinase family enzyme
MSARRLAAVGALLLGLAAALLMLITLVQDFPRGLLVVGALLATAGGAWYAFVRRGVVRFASGALAAGGAAGLIALFVTGDRPEWVAAVGLVAGAAACTRFALGARARLEPAPPPRRPVLFVNPRSGDGKAGRANIAGEALSRGIEVVVLGPEDDLEVLVCAAVADGADGLAMAGGDGSQAIVASIAAEAGLPYACIPAGTRNHFALDLGVDRDDVVGALDAFVDGGERRVDLAEVNGRIFVNNVSLGIYAEAVQREGYRRRKVGTLLATLADWQRGEGSGPALRWRGPGGHVHDAGATILVSNNSYRLGHVVASGTRPRIDDGVLGIAVAGSAAGSRPPQRPWRQWSAPSFEVDADAPVPAGIDGEAAMLDPPLRFRIHPAVLRARVAMRHPGASPSALLPEHLSGLARSLTHIALGSSRG